MCTPTARHRRQNRKATPSVWSNGGHCRDSKDKPDWSKAKDSARVIENAKEIHPNYETEDGRNRGNSK